MCRADVTVTEFRQFVHPGVRLNQGTTATLLRVTMTDNIAPEVGNSAKSPLHNGPVIGMVSGDLQRCQAWMYECVLSGNEAPAAGGAMATSDNTRNRLYSNTGQPRIWVTLAGLDSKVVDPRTMTVESFADGRIRLFPSETDAVFKNLASVRPRHCVMRPCMRPAVAVGTLRERRPAEPDHGRMQEEYLATGLPEIEIVELPSPDSPQFQATVAAAAVTQDGSGGGGGGGGPGGGSAVLGAVAGGCAAAALLIGGGIAFLVMRRRRKPVKGKLAGVRRVCDAWLRQRCGRASTGVSGLLVCRERQHGTWRQHRRLRHRRLSRGGRGR